MSHFFITSSQVQGNDIMITGEDVNHIKNVLRMQKGETFTAADDNQVFYRCQITSLDKEIIQAEILSRENKTTELPSRISLYQGLPKSDKMEWIIQKAVELGADEIIPVEMERCVVKLDAKKKAAKCKRWQGIAEGAAKQSGRMKIPMVCEVMTYDDALKEAGKCSSILLPYEGADNMEHTREILSSLPGEESIGIFIGPEGGFASGEVNKAEAMGAKVITLGKRILRTETAGMTVLSILMYLLEE